MNISLCYTASPNNMLVKEYTSIGSYSGNMRSEISALNPTINIELGNNTSGVMEANYAYIPDFGKYYFIRNKTCIVNSLWKFDLEEDVLMTYHDDILTGSGIVERQKDNYDMYLRDNMIPISARKTVAVRKFANPFTDAHPCVLMLVLGG